MSAINHVGIMVTSQCGDAHRARDLAVGMGLVCTPLTPSYHPDYGDGPTVESFMVCPCGTKWDTQWPAREKWREAVRDLNLEWAEVVFGCDPAMGGYQRIINYSY